MPPKKSRVDKPVNVLLNKKNDNSKQKNDMAEQEIGYSCICGFKTKNKREFNKHIMLEARKDGKGTHKSIGRIDMQTGEVVTPPWAERSMEERQRTKYSGGDGKVKQTERLAEAQEIRVVPRVFTMDYSPIMRAAQDAATKIWNWRPDMPLGNFIDTVLFLFFQEKGITLCGYIVDESLLVKEEQHGS